MPACRITKRDPEALADAILELILDAVPSRPPRKPSEAREWIAANLSVEANAARMAEIYREALGPFMPAPR